MDHIFGHTKQRNILSTDITKKRIHHAYMFRGPKHTGKFTLAKAFAEKLQNQDTANVKTQLDTYEYPDNEETLKIEDIRNIQQYMTRSFSSPYRIILLQNIERMSLPAQNAFLKILEEPPTNTLFIMTCSDISKILPTTLSRVSLHNFYCHSEKVIREILTSVETSKQHVDEIVNIAQGRTGIAKKLALDPEFFQSQKDLFNKVQKTIEEKNVVKCFQLADEASSSKQSAKALLHVLLTILRKKMFTKATMKTTTALENITKGILHIEQNINKKLVLENALLLSLS